MILDVITYPDKRLFEKSADVVKFDNELAKFLDDMYDTMIAKNGIGLAAIQVGKPIRVFIINLINEDEVQDKNDLLEIINPKFISKDGEIVYQEGCLSVPGYYEDVKRAKDIKIQFQDRFGNLKELEADGLLSVAIQHENDHLDGHLFIEKIGFNKRKKFDKEYKKKSKLKPI
ncbi:peptide deformylase [Campylobacter fetus]|uniref:Peptide deformylase n=4 Tax=Campylobacter fetus TaxID=196 RepID=A0A5L4IGD4_CAMFE|nr:MULTISPECIES: peptide deformylase [Campylobacter]OCS21995.1 peptide deformylase [Campylobacter fetus subsp. venerealis cfvi97/532]OCS26579.1 peptide deformylase [Campylobacter fetus subsp. venerealis cfvB10]OCS29149.1 peptide deformylase [Campylobacter fetus subsp. venerealis LMG 6570 = CCUG 33900]OCS42611.1 peptide deformylase [Campylobacter fetus subsp. venerealis cfvi02/298]ABK82963.1 peptide deformylase [Campylobacter fetus subsp. fetus 82-40]